MNTQINKSMNMREWGTLLFLSLLWGGSFFFIEVAITELPPFTVVFLRVSLAALALWLFVVVTGITLPRAPEVWRAFLIMGLLNNVVPFSLIVWGQTHIAAGLASILNATTPLFGVIVAGVMLSDERPTPLKLAGVVIGFAGTVIMIGPSALQLSETGTGIAILAQCAVLGASLFYAMGGVYGRRFKRMNINPVMAATGQVSASAIILAPIVLIIDQPLSLPFPGIQTITAVFALATFSTALAFILYFRLLASAGATNLLLVTFLIPVSAILLGILILDEKLETIHFVGMSLIACGLSAIDGRLWRFVDVKSESISNGRK